MDPTFKTLLAEAAYLECPADGKPDILRLEMPTLCAALDDSCDCSCHPGATVGQGECVIEINDQLDGLPCCPSADVIHATSAAEACEGICWTQTSGSQVALNHLVPTKLSGGMPANCSARCGSSGSPGCNGVPEYGAEMEPAMLCLSRKECEELCIAEKTCVGFD